MLKAYRYRIYPTEEQKTQFARHFGHVRHIYNWAREEKIKHYEDTKKSLSRKMLQDRLVAMKKIDKPWLTEINSQSLLAALFQLEGAFQNFFQGRAGYPKRKKKYQGHQSFQCPQHVSIDFENKLMTLPKIKNIKIKVHRELNGKIKTVTISKNPANHYFSSVLVETSDTVPLKSTIEEENTVGLDVGLMHYLIDSDGNKTPHPKLLSSGLSKLRKTQQQFSRGKKESKNLAKQKQKVARVHERVANQRHEFIHQLTANLVFKNQATSFAVEDLHIKGMIKNRKLSKAISDSAWRTFVTTLSYKCDWYGKNLLKANRFAPSSKTCHMCHQKQKAMPLSIRIWRCECGVLHDRDINAAINIKLFALADALGYSVCVKQFPCHDNVQRRCDSERSWLIPARWVARSPHQNA